MKYRIETKWIWDGRLVGSGDTPEQDEVLTVMEGITIPTMLVLNFPVEQTHEKLSEYAYGALGFRGARRRGDAEIPVMAMSRIQAEVRIAEQ